MNQFFYLPPVARSVVAALEKAVFSYYGVEDEWDDDLPGCCGFRISIDDVWGADEWGDDIRYLRAIWIDTGDVWEIELFKLSSRERARIAEEKVVDLIQKAIALHRISPGQLCLFEEAAT